MPLFSEHEETPDTRFRCEECRTLRLGSLFDLVEGREIPTCCGKHMEIENTMINLDYFLRVVSNVWQERILASPTASERLHQAKERL